MSEHPLETALVLLASARAALLKDFAALKTENRALQEQANLAYIAAKQETRVDVDALRKRLTEAYAARSAALVEAGRAVAKAAKVIEAEAKEADLIRRAGVHPTRIWFRVSPRKALSAYGFGRYPVTLYANQWIKVLANKDKILDFIRDNEGRLARPRQ